MTGFASAFLLASVSAGFQRTNFVTVDSDQTTRPHVANISNQTLGEPLQGGQRLSIVRVKDLAYVRLQ
jgi:hypothetical protein